MDKIFMCKHKKVKMYFVKSDPGTLKMRETGWRMGVLTMCCAI